MTASQPNAANGTDTIDSCRHAALAVILVFLALRLLLAAQLPLIADEAYAVVVSRLPSLSYFDHPPLGFDFGRAAAWAFGSEAGFVVRLPHVILGSLSAWLLFPVTRQAFGGRAGFWAVAWYSVTPFFFVSGGHFVVPDGPLNFFLLLTLWLVLPDLLGDEKPDLRRWLLAGLTLGLAALSKYTAVLFGMAAMIVLLSSPRGRRILASPGPWAAVVIAALCLTPVLIWNVQNGWASFGFQSGRAAGGGFNPANFLFVQLGQAGFLLPWLWAIAVYVIALGLIRPRDPAERIFAILAALPVVLFDVVAMFGREILPHWSMPGFLFAFPLVGVWCARLAATRPRLLRGSFVFSAILVPVLALGAIVQIDSAAITRALGLGERSDFSWTFLDWDDLSEDFSRRGIIDDPDTFIVPASWVIGAKAGHALGPAMPVADPIVDPRHFAFMEDARLAGRTRGYALEAAWPSEAERATADLRRIAGGRYELAGDPWIIAQERAGNPAFIVVVQPVKPRSD
jgi:hypothetical protein